MTTEAPDRKDLESKDKESLMAIAKAMGGKPTTRSTKADLVDIIVDLASGEADTNSESQESGSPANAAYSADPMADARAEATQDVSPAGDSGSGAVSYTHLTLTTIYSV